MNHSCQGGCPEGFDQDFKSKMLTGMTNLSVKMDMLVGKDGNNGRFSATEEKVETLTRWMDQQQGTATARNDIWQKWASLIASVSALMAVIYHILSMKSRMQ